MGQSRHFCKKIESLFFRSTTELIFSVKNFFLNTVTGNNHYCSGKNLYVEKNDLKLTKNRFFGYGILTTFRKSHFSTTNIETNYKKVNTATETALKTACNEVLVFSRTYRIDAII